MFRLNIQQFAESGSSEEMKSKGDDNISSGKKNEPNQSEDVDTKQLSEELKMLKGEFESYKSTVEGMKDSVNKNSTDLAKVTTEVGGIKEAYKEAFIRPSSDNAQDNKEEPKGFNLFEAITNVKR